MKNTYLILLVFVTVSLGGYIQESRRDIPVIEEVDVLVIGGNSYAVAAAAAAAQGGANVFLAAERPYLGADICRTRELWIEGMPQTDMSRAVFESGSVSLKGANFEYTSSVESDKRHADTPQPSMLNDAAFGDPARDSVQYNQHVKIDIDMGEVEKVTKVCLHAYQRLDDFVVADYDLYAGIQGKGWQKLATVKNDSIHGNTDRVSLCFEEPFEAQQLSLRIHKGAGIPRVLLGEITVETEDSAQNAISVPVKPFDIKYALDNLLLDNGVTFLYGCYPAEVLKDSGGRVSGVVFANRAGRQAIIAETVIDASANATAARLAGAKLEAFDPGAKRFERIVIGGKYINTGLEYHKLPEKVEDKYDAVVYRMDFDLTEDSFAEYCRAEQIFRDKSWSPEQLDASDKIIYSPRKVVCKGGSGFDGLLADGFSNLYILGSCGDEQAAANAVEMLEYGEKLGEYIGGLQKNGKSSGRLDVINGNEKVKVSQGIKGDVKEFLNGPRSFDQEFKSVTSEGLKLQVIEGYDVVVIGGGTGGAPAAIAASRQGAKTLVVEYLDGLGGIGTSGLIGRYCIGYRKGFTEEIDRGMADLGGYEYVVDNEGLGTPWDIELKKEWYRRELRKNDCDIWFGAIGCGALVDDGTVKGVVVATPYGRVVVTADVVIDSTGNSDIAAAAGSDIIYTDADTVEVQGTGLPPRQLGARYTNTDYSFVDDGDMIDIWRMHVTAKKKFQGSYDIAQIIDTSGAKTHQGKFHYKSC